MRDFRVIGDMGETLKKLLEEDPWTGISPKPEISFKSPKEIKDDGGSTNKVSLFLYEILEHIHLRNEEPERIDDSHLRLPPIVLDPKAEGIVLSGAVTETLADYIAKNAVDLVGIATHGSSGVSRWVWGSVADRLLRTSCAPIMMVRAPGSHPGI